MTTITLLCSVCHEDFGFSDSWLFSVKIGKDATLPTESFKLFCKECGMKIKQQEKAP